MTSDDQPRVHDCASPELGHPYLIVLVDVAVLAEPARVELLVGA